MPQIQFHISDGLAPKGERQSNILTLFLSDVSVFHLWFDDIYTASLPVANRRKYIFFLFFFSIKKKKEKCSHPYWPILRENALDEEIIFFPLNRISQQQRNLVVFFSSETIFQNSWVSLPTLISTCIREVYNDPYDANIDSRKEQDKVEFFLKSQI